MTAIRSEKLHLGVRDALTTQVCLSNLMLPEKYDVLLTAHLRIILAIDQLNAQILLVLSRSVGGRPATYRV